MQRKIKNSKKITRNFFFAKQKLKHQKQKEWEEEVEEFLQNEQRESKIAEPNENESYVNSKNQQCFVVNGPISNPGNIHNFAKLTGTNDDEKRFVIPITLNKSPETKEELIKEEISNEEPPQTEQELQTKQEPTTEATNEEEENPVKTETKNAEEMPETTTIQTKQGIRAIAQCEYKTPKPANTDITDVLQAINTITKTLKNIKNEQNKLRESIHNCDLETSDLLHEIELNEYNEEEEAVLYQKLKEVRQRRRTYKIRYTYVEELNIFNNSVPTLQTRLINLHKKLTEIKENHNNSKYAPRIRTDIKESNKIKYIAKKR